VLANAQASPGGDQISINWRSGVVTAADPMQMSRLQHVGQVTNNTFD